MNRISSSLRPRTVVITGATAGIGREAARQIAVALASEAGRLILVSRSAAKLEETARWLMSEARGIQVETIAADLSLVKEARRAAAEVRSRAASVDVLFNNAGALYKDRRVTTEGIELTFALNHLGYFVFTNELLPALHAAPRARIVSTASDAHRAGFVDLGDLNFERMTAGFRVYGTSKLMNILFTAELARRLKGTNVTANCFHPGFVASQFGEGNGLAYDWMMKLAKLVARTVTKGADTGVHLCLSPEVEGVSGEYFSDRRKRRPNRQARDAALAGNLWKATEQVVARIG